MLRGSRRLTRLCDAPVGLGVLGVLGSPHGINNTTAGGVLGVKVQEMSGQGAAGGGGSVCISEVS